MTTANEFDLNGLPIFVALVEAGSFTKAAERLGCTKTRVSLQIRQLETRLGVTLFHRTTRRVQLTQAGEALYHQCHPLLASLQGALESTVSDTQQLHGELRITAPEDYSSGVLSDVVVAFSRLHPALHIELRSGDQVSDMVQEGIDLAFRLGWLKDSTLRARRLGTFQQYVVAAPSYLKRHGVPAHPKALETHDWIAFTPLKAPLTWAFKQQETLVNVKVSSQFDGEFSGFDRCRRRVFSAARYYRRTGNSGRTLGSRFGRMVSVRGGCLCGLPAWTACARQSTCVYDIF